MPFDIRQLRYAIYAADHGSFYRAARALDVEQSTLSRAILKLERALGTDIFIRTRAGVTTTISGARFLRSARPMVANADRMVATTRAAGQGRAGSLTIGMNSSVSAGNLRATVLGWRHDNPNVGLDGVEADRTALLAGLDTGEVDIAILMARSRTATISARRFGANVSSLLYPPTIRFRREGSCIGRICGASDSSYLPPIPVLIFATCCSEELPNPVSILTSAFIKLAARRSSAFWARQDR